MGSPPISGAARPVRAVRGQPASHAGRILQFERVLAGRVATRVVALPFGVARICPDLPRIYSASGVEVTGPVAGGDLLRTTESVFVEAGLRHHRRIHTAVAEVARSVGPVLEAAGWARERLTYMAHDRRPRPVAAASGFAVVDIDTWAPAARRFVADEGWGRDPAVQDDMAMRDRRMAARIDVRFVLAGDGSAGCRVYRHGPIAQVEDVYVLNDARGRGLGRGLLACALHQCRDADVVFLVADADDWPRRWYGRAGFSAVGRGWDWLLER